MLCPSSWFAPRESGWLYRDYIGTYLCHGQNRRLFRDWWPCPHGHLHPFTQVFTHIWCHVLQYSKKLWVRTSSLLFEINTIIWHIGKVLNLEYQKIGWFPTQDWPKIVLQVLLTGWTLGSPEFEASEHAAVKSERTFLTIGRMCLSCGWETLIAAPWLSPFCVGKMDSLAQLTVPSIHHWIVDDSCSS